MPLLIEVKNPPEEIDFGAVLHVARILEAIVIELTENLLSQDRLTNRLSQVVVKLDGFDIEGVFL